MKNYIKSPLNYTGGKYKLLPQLLPLFPEEINTFVDLFCGGCNVSVNVNANQILCNDTEKVIIDLYNELKKITPEKAVELVKNTVKKYELSKTNEEGYKNIRDDYNKGNKEWFMFYALLTNAFNYQIRFNKKGDFNMPFGRERSSFNPTLEQNLINFVKALNEKNIFFSNNSFEKLNLNRLKDSDFVYCDPPYLITCASYNEHEGWNEEKERKLLSLLDELNDKGVKFALSNVLENKWKENLILKEWAKKYNIHHLNHSYNNCNYHAKDKSKNSTDEVLITNYKKE